MRRLFLVLLMLASTSPCLAWKWPWERVGLDLNLLKAEVAQDAFQKADALAKVNGRIDTLEVRLNAEIKANMTAAANAGIANRQNTNTVGRDQKTFTKNDTGLMKYIVGELVGIIGLLVAFYERILFLIFKTHEKEMKAKDNTISNLIEKIDIREKERDKFQDDLIKSQTERIKELTDRGR